MKLASLAARIRALEHRLVNRRLAAAAPIIDICFDHAEPDGHIISEPGFELVPGRGLREVPPAADVPKTPGDESSERR
jgi:hypothetical protein